ncbi:MAG: efflux RND transporter periplasmic adaptor subunit [Magnetococcus sp. MYC-9]
MMGKTFFGVACIGTGSLLLACWPWVSLSQDEALARKGQPAVRSSDATVGCFTQPRKDVSLALPVPGRVAEVGAREGDLVKAGQLLVRLEESMQRIKVALARKTWEDKSQLVAARFKEQNEKTLLAMYEQLHQQNRSISLEELQKKRLEYQLSSQEREHIEFQETQEKLNVEMEEEELKRNSLVSPLDGMVLHLGPDLGESVQANQVVVRVADTHTGLLVCNLEEGLAKRLVPGGPVRLQLQTVNGAVSRDGKVIFLSPVMDVASGLVEIKVEFDNTDQSVRLGTPGRIGVPGDP